MGNCDPSVYPFDLFQAADGHFVCAAYDPITFRRLCETIGRPDLTGKEEYRDYGTRWRHRTKLKEIIEAWSSGRTVEEVIRVLQGHSVPVGPVLNIREVVESEHIRVRGMVVEVADSEVGKVRIPGSAVKMSETPATIETSAPHLGEHTDEILHDLLGFSNDEIRELRERKVV
jgi:crotonobetainyl-CoA:carnitine CoA-transferase CaiB-like acyl-CoA transferase